MLRSHNLFELGDDLVRREAVGGDFDRVVCLYERADRPRRIAMVAQPLIGEHFVERNVFAAGLQIGMPAAGSFLFVGREEDFALGVGKNDRSLVAALGDDVVVRRRGAAATRRAGRGRPGCRPRSGSPS